MTDLPLSNVAAVLLAGGQSRRMGYPKALLEMGDQKLINYQVNALSVMVSPIFIAGGALSLDFDPWLADKVIPDFLTELYQGPLSGILAGIEEAEKVGCEYLQVWSCDSLINLTMVAQEVHQAQLILQQNPQYGACYFATQDKEYPLLGLYRCSVSHIIKNYLIQGARRVMPLLDLINATRIYLPDHLATIANLNTPDHFERAKQTYHQLRLTHDYSAL